MDEVKFVEGDIFVVAEEVVVVLVVLFSVLDEVINVEVAIWSRHAA